MTSAYPCIDSIVWVRWILAVTFVWWFPGWLLLRGRLADWPGPLAFYLRLAIGVFWTVLLGMLVGWTGTGFPVVAYVCVSLFLAWVLGRPRLPGRPTTAPSAPGRRWWWLAVPCLILLGVQILGFAGFAAPPHIHDASNHAYLVLRITQVGSLHPDLLFGGTAPRPEVPYLAGWHLVAAITGRVAGLTPYLAAWLMPMTAVLLTPLALAVLWRRWGAGAVACTFAGLWLASNAHMPTGLFGWGGFGQQIGFFLAPVGAIVLAEAWRARRWSVAMLAGLSLAVMIHIHFSEVVVMIGLALLDLTRRRAKTAVASPGAVVLAATAFVVGLAVAIDPAFLKLAAVYNARFAASHTTGTLYGVGDAAWRFIMLIGRPDVRALVVFGGLGLALATRTWRWFAVTSLALGILYLSLSVWGDPVSRALAIPFYGQAARVGYLQIYFFPLLAGLATERLHAAATRRHRLFGCVVAVLAAFLLIGGIKQEVKTLASFETVVPFSAAEYNLARLIPEYVGTDDVVANFYDDGSTWAMHVCGRRFTLPMSWECLDPQGRPIIETVTGLLDDPWPVRTRALRNQGVNWLYVSDHRFDEESGVNVADFVADPRFETVLQNDTTRLFRILWERANLWYD